MIIDFIEEAEMIPRHENASDADDLLVAMEEHHQ